MRLIPGVTPALAAQALTDLAVKAENLRSYAGPGEQLRYRDNYLQWVEEAERACAALFEDEEYLPALHSNRYRTLVAAQAGTPRLSPQITLEVERQAERLRALADQLSPAGPAPTGAAGRYRPGSSAGVRAVPDTNVLLHFLRFDQLDWPTMLGAERVELVVPLLVVEELDERKNRGDALGKRAAGVTRRLMEVVEEQEDTGAEHRPGVRVRILPDPVGHARRPNNDDEILDRALLAVGEDPTVIVTGDTAMRLRAQTRGLTWHLLADDLRLPPVDTAERKLRALEEELERQQRQQPRLVLRFKDGQGHLQLPERQAVNLNDVRQHLTSYIEEEIQACREQIAPRSTSSKSRSQFSIAALEPTEAELESYRRRVKEYRTELEQWSEQYLRHASASAVGVSLPLVLLNDGGASAEDVEVTLRLVGGAARLWLQDDLDEPPDAPDRPRHPSRYDAVAIPPYFPPITAGREWVEPDWEVDDAGRVARRRLALVRHTGEPRDLPGLVVSTADGQPLPGLSMKWQLAGVRPALNLQDSLNLVPAEQS